MLELKVVKILALKAKILPKNDINNLTFKHAMRNSDPLPVLIAILTALPENHPLLWPLLLYIQSAFEAGDKQTLARAFQQARPGNEAMVSLAAREWMAEGEARGRTEGKAEALTQFLLRRFGPVSDSVTARIEAADSETLDRWIGRVIDAPTVDGVFDQEP
jgi:hypothetical protein